MQVWKNLSKGRERTFKLCLEPKVESASKFRQLSDALLFEKGEVCHKSVPRFNSEKKDLPTGTECRYKRTPSIEEKSVSKFCFEPKV